MDPTGQFVIRNTFIEIADGQTNSLGTPQEHHTRRSRVMSDLSDMRVAAMIPPTPYGAYPFMPMPVPGTMGGKSPNRRKKSGHGQELSTVSEDGTNNPFLPLGAGMPPFPPFMPPPFWDPTLAMMNPGGVPGMPYPGMPGMMDPYLSQAAAVQAAAAASASSSQKAGGKGGDKRQKGVWIDDAKAQASPSGSKTAPAKLQNAEAQLPPADATTVMLRNVPNRYNQQMLLTLLDEQGFKGIYDFVYLPMDFRNAVNLGYAFVNVQTHKDALRMMNTFQGFSQWFFDSAKICEVSWAHPHQGYKEHVERYRNSPVMHPSMPEEYKPMLFKNGERITFPAPTKAIRAPKLRPVRDRVAQGGEGEGWHTGAA
jgi:hypothetical protein